MFPYVAENSYLCSRFTHIEHIMKFAIIAAGEGSRLAAEGITVPKPLVTVRGEHLIDRLIRIFMDNDAEEIDVIVNDRTNLVSMHLLGIEEEGLNGFPVPLQMHVRTTPSSMHSFYDLSPMLKGNPFVLTTVDTIFKEDEFREYVAAFKQALDGGLDGLMGVTGFVDDERPLYVGTDDDMNVTGFYDTCNPPCRYISAGIYGLAPNSLDTLQGCIERGESHLRNFQRALIRDGRHLKAWSFSKVLDIDHAADISKAEDFLSTQH